MQITLLSCTGGAVMLPARNGALVSGADGGNLIVNPPRDVWERSELSAQELRDWSCLVAATGSAMLSCLPQLDGGCINYWEAGNWALNDDAPPKGRKRAPDHRSMHLHLLGRSMIAKSPNWRWGESPVFPRYKDKNNWAGPEDRLTPAEAHAIVSTATEILIEKYGFAAKDIEPIGRCSSCSYSIAGLGAGICVECR